MKKLRNMFQMKEQDENLKKILNKTKTSDLPEEKSLKKEKGWGEHF